MVKILTLQSRSTGVSYYRGETVMRQLCKANGWQFDAIAAENVTPELLNSYHIYFDLRPTNEKNLNMMYLAWKAGCKIWVDLDDLLWNIPPSNSAATTWSPTAEENLFRALAAADVVTVTTEELAKHTSTKTDRPVIVIPNAWNDYAVAMPNTWNGDDSKTPGVATYFWRGSNTHSGDLYSHRDLFSERNDVIFRFMGELPWYLLKSYGGHLDRLNWDSFTPNTAKYFDKIKEIAPEAFIFPLEDNDFNRCKSNIAWIEATLAGAACIASQLPEFEEVDSMMLDETKFEYHPDFFRKAFDLSRQYIAEYLRLSQINHQRAQVVEMLTGQNTTL
jgi:hypothetical protein